MGLLELLTDTPAPEALGNFTEIPDEQLIQDCVDDHALSVLSGDVLAEELKRPEPAVKVLRLLLQRAMFNLSLR